MLASRASYDKNMLARQVIPLHVAPGYQTALSSCPEYFECSYFWIVSQIIFFCYLIASYLYVWSVGGWTLDSTLLWVSSVMPAQWHQWHLPNGSYATLVFITFWHHLWCTCTVKSLLSGPHIKRTPFIKWNPAEVPKFLSNIYCKINLHSADTC